MGMGMGTGMGRGRRMTNSSVSPVWMRIAFFTVMAILTIWANYEAAERAVEYIVVVVKTPASQHEERVGLMQGRVNDLTLFLKDAAHFVYTILYANPRYPRKDIHTVVLSIDNNYKECAVSEDNVIHINSEYIANAVEEEIKGSLYRETGRLWLWNGGQKAPLGLIEGMAEYIRLAAGFNVANPSVPIGELDNTEQWWDAGGVATAMFLQYCEGIKSGFVADLNARMEKEWKMDLLEELLGKNATMVWSEFKNFIKIKMALKTGTVYPDIQTV